MTEAIKLAVHRFRLRENQIFLVLTIIIGVLSGLSAVLFTLSIEATRHLLFGLEPSTLRLLLVPALVSIVTGFLLAKFFPDVRGSGVPQTKAAYQINEGNIAPHVPLGKFLTGVLCVGSGHSMGREGPSVQIGAGLASLIGKWLRLSPSQIQNLVPIGAAAALSAAFNTPIAAVLFALEEIIGDLNAALIGSAVLASVSAVIVERAILGNEPLFRVPAYHLVNPTELAFYALLGIVGGLISLVFTRGLLATRRLFLRLPAWTDVWQPAMGGVVIGAILIFYPQVMGVGYEYIDQALNGSMLLRTLLLLCAVKLVATIVSYSSGNAGGIFAPSLYLGAMVGGAAGLIVQQLAPFPTGGPGAYALVGMGTLFAGIIRAPITSVFMIFELTQDYQIIVPLMVANMLSFAISKRFQPVPVYDALLEQTHIYLPGPESRTPIGRWRARDLMTRDFILLAPSETIANALSRTGSDGAQCFLVGDRERLISLVTRKRLDQAAKSGRSSEPVISVQTAAWTHAFPDHPLDEVLDRLSQNPGILPVLSRTGLARIEGVITPEKVLEFLSAKAGHEPADLTESQKENILIK